MPKKTFIEYAATAIPNNYVGAQSLKFELSFSRLNQSILL